MTIDTKVPTGRITFTFSDNDNKEFASFVVNPADLTVCARCEEICKYLEEQKKSGITTAKAFQEFSEKLETKIAYVVDCDPKDIFGKISAVTVLPSGELFASLVLGTIRKAISDEAQRRREKRMEHLKKYTEKYDVNPSAGLAPGQTL